jgi:hypothetical protein
MQVLIAFLVPLLSWLAAGLIQRVLVGAGLSLIVGVGFEALISSSLASAASNLSGGGGSALAFARLLGVGDFLSIVGTALVTRAYITLTSGAVMGMRKA